MAVLHLPRSLIALFPEPPPRLLEVEASDVKGLVRELDARWPGMWDRLCEPGPRLREHINVFVDGERVALEAAIAPGSIVHVIPAVAGG
jgi:molybdopterin synthase sulfur carrier subunit